VDINTCLAVFQLEGYKTGRYFRWLARNARNPQSVPAREPVWTSKAKLIRSLGLAAPLLLSILVLFFSSLSLFLLFAVCICGLCYSVGRPLLPVFGLWMLRPYEIANRVRVRKFIQDKCAALQKKGLTVIGITGSYGKTSTKMILNHLLTDCLMTPKSFNTLFGIYKVVDLELDQHYRRFICEMGAYKKGDIAEFCDLVHPQIALLTGINETHLERFGSIENTIQAKFEIVEAVRNGGLAIVNLDDERVRTEVARRTGRIIGYTLSGRTSPACSEIAVVTDIVTVGGRTRFTLNFRDRTDHFETSLLGKGHLLNLTGALVAALEMGESPADLERRVKTLPQIARRLEYRREGHLHILDNSFSSNPDSFRESLDVLSTFEGRRVLITPGIVELGPATIDIHQRLGALAAGKCDAVILVGKSEASTALRSGLLANGFTEEQILHSAPGEELNQKLSQISVPGAAVLFENVSELPIHYR